MTVRVQVEAELLSWARERARLTFDDLVARFPNLDAWESGEIQPTLKQLEAYAKATHTPVGFFFLSEPPEEYLPLPDFRTIRDREIDRPSSNLLDTIFLCEQRQEWFHNFARTNREETLSFVGSLTVSTGIVEAAAAMQEILDFDVEKRRVYSTWSDALSGLAFQAESAGVLVMVNGVVGSNTHRVLDPEEFRGFSIVDEYAPVVFVNGADTKAAQIFTLAHELAHVWLGETGVSNVTVASAPSGDIEKWCNEVAAEFLVPKTSIQSEYQSSPDLTSELDRLARRFKVSTLVVLRRLNDIGVISSAQFPAIYEQELHRVLALRSGGSGGNFYNTQPVRVSKTFARAIIGSTLEGQTLYSDAFHLLGFKKLSTFNELAQNLGVTG